MYNLPFLLSLWFGLVLPSQTNIPSLSVSNYRCAKYMVFVDFSRIMPVAPQAPPGMTSFIYYIQYGDDVVIEIKDPGMEVPYLPVIKAEWHYKDGFSYVETILRHTQMYYPKKDTLTFSISESRGSVEEICKQELNKTYCDSLLFKPNSTEEPFLVYLANDTPNIHSTDLFYPDVEYLPLKIVPKNQERSILILDEVISGKEAIDSILHQFSHEGYERLSDEDIEFANKHAPVEDAIKLYEQTKKKPD